MARQWSDIRASARTQTPHPLLSFGGNLAKITAENLASDAPACTKPVLSLAVGDPSLDGNLPPPAELMDAMAAEIEKHTANGYTPSSGAPHARQAVADYWFRRFVAHPAGAAGDADDNTLITADDVLLTSGCSDALNVAFGAIANPGDIVLLPQPFFAQYTMTAAYYGITAEFYSLVAEKNWEVDLAGLEALVQRLRATRPETPVRGILLNNPSNPCGSNWSAAHVREIVLLCEKLQLPILSDEIYAGMVFDINEPASAGSSTAPPFTSVASVMDSTCIRFVLAGASKCYSIPGQRVGWIIRLDEHNYARYNKNSKDATTASSSSSPAPSPTADVMQGMRRLCGRYLVPMTVMQNALVACLGQSSTPAQQQYFETARCLLRDNARYLYSELSTIDVLTPIVPQGGMFMSVLLNAEKLEPALRTDSAFCNAFAREENVHLFPGEPFRMPSALRIVLSRPMEVNKDVVQRLRDFCERHKA